VIIAVFDTNVLASGIAGYTTLSSTPGELLRRWRDSEFTLVVSEHILAELARTFTNPYFTRRLSSSEVKDAFAKLRSDAVFQPITVQVAGIASHTQDDAIIATALSAQATHLVTGDKRLQERGSTVGVTMLSPRAFLDLLEMTSDEEP
jgi:putative PIN family toxin of toxin-antitoxin system